MGCSSELVEKALNSIIRQPDITLWNLYEADDSQYSFDPLDYEKVRSSMIQALLDAKHV